MASKIDIKHERNPDLPIVKKGWKGNITIHGEFHNNIIPEKPPLLDVLKWKLSRNPQKAVKKADTFSLSITRFNQIDKQKDAIIWLGHSSFIIVINGKALIIDPVFFNVSVIKRKVAVPCNLEVLKEIDYLLISHDHRDHLDVKSLDIIAKNNPNIQALLPLGIGSLLNTNTFKTIHKQEAGWYQEYDVGQDMRIIFLPAKHWGRRGAFDYNKSLWGGFLIIANDKKIFFSGDTAYDTTIFKEIHTEFGNIDVCLLPIGAYSPKYMMKDSHTTPEEAIQIFNDLGGKTFIPMHYGTYDLSDEPLGEPIERLKKGFTNKEGLQILKVGESFEINN